MDGDTSAPLSGLRAPLSSGGDDLSAPLSVRSSSAIVGSSSSSSKASNPARVNEKPHLRRGGTAPFRGAPRRRSNDVGRVQGPSLATTSTGTPQHLMWDEDFRRKSVVQDFRQPRASIGVVRTASMNFMREQATQDEMHLQLSQSRELSHSSGWRGKLRWHVNHFWFLTQPWLLVTLLATATGLTGCVIMVLAEAIASLRLGICPEGNWHAGMLRSYHFCPPSSWHAWGDGIFAFTVFFVPGVLLAVVGSLLVFSFAPVASGSGIPESKVVLNGFVVPDAVSGKTLAVKVPSLILGVSSGLALGSEESLVHVSMCWASVLCSFQCFTQYQNEGKRREIHSAAAAAGIAAGLGAPIGGVLFSFEEVSSAFPAVTLLRAFTAGVGAAIVLQIVNITETKKLTMFDVDYATTVDPKELLAFAFLGVLGGLIGAAFNHLNLAWNRLRLLPRFKSLMHPVVEVGIVAALTIATSWPLMKTRLQDTDVIHALFRSCDGSVRARKLIGICESDGVYAENTWPLMGSLLAASFLRFVQMTFAVGLRISGGIFGPSIFIGSCLGRAVGQVVLEWNESSHVLDSDVQPGLYAVVGALAVLCGVTHNSLSLLVIMLELTDSLVYIVPFMVTILCAKLVGDAISGPGIYEAQIRLRDYPFLQEEMDVTFTQRCCDIMEDNLVTLNVGGSLTVDRARSLMREHQGFRGFPVVDGDHFVGYVRRRPLGDMVENLGAAGGEQRVVTLADVFPLTDTSVFRMVPDGPLSQAHTVFKQLQVQHIFVVGAKGYGAGQRQDVLCGVITKKNFIQYLKTGQIGRVVGMEAQKERLQATHQGVLGERRMSTSMMLSMQAGQAKVRAQERRSSIMSNVEPFGLSMQPVMEGDEGEEEDSQAGAHSSSDDRAGEASTNSSSEGFGSSTTEKDGKEDR